MMPQPNIIARAISQTFPRRVSNVLGQSMTARPPKTARENTIDSSELKNRRAVPMSRVIGAGVDLTQFESDYYYSANFDMLFVERGSRLDVWLYLAI